MSLCLNTWFDLLISRFKLLQHFSLFRRGGIPARNAKGERLLLFVGIIDILQSYRLKKKLEHTWKSILHDGVSILLEVCVALTSWVLYKGFISSLLQYFIQINRFDIRSFFFFVDHLNITGVTFIETTLMQKVPKQTATQKWCRHFCLANWIRKIQTYTTRNSLSVKQYMM